MSTQKTDEARAQTALAVGAVIELTTRVFEKITGDVISGKINEVTLNKTAAAELIASSVNTALLAKSGSAK